MMELVMDFEQGEVMEFAKKMTGFPSGLVSFLTELPLKGHKEIRVTNYRVQIPVLVFLYLLRNVFAMVILRLRKRYYLLELELFHRGAPMFIRNFAC